VAGILPADQEAVTLRLDAVVNRQASWNQTFTKTGTHSIFARYLGDQNYLPRTSAAVKQVIN